MFADCHSSIGSKDDLKSAVDKCLGESKVGDCSDGPIGDWDVSRVTDMTQTFYKKWPGYGAFDKDLSKWEVSQVTDMSQMFQYALAFNGDISKWDVSRVTDMTQMFERAETFNQDLSKWKVSQVTDMTRMFHRANAFDQDLGTWDVSNVKDMTGMFYMDYNAKPTPPFTGKGLGNWKVSSVTSMREMFHTATKFIGEGLGNWNLPNLIHVEDMFYYAQSFKGEGLSKWKLPKVTSLRGMFNGAKSFNENLPTWDVSNITNMESTFIRTKVRGLSKWKMPKATSIAYMFGGADFDEDLSEWNGNMPKVTNMEGMFSGAPHFTGEFLSKWDVSNVTNMGVMFMNTNIFNADITKWDVSKVTDMAGMFQGTSAFNQDISEWNVANVRTMSSMFHIAKVFNQDLSKWDVSKVTNMYYMFAAAYEFYQVLCGETWLKANANRGVQKSHLFWQSPGKISETCETTPNACKTNNGGCDKNRRCMKKWDGDRECKECLSGWIQEGDTCKACPAGHVCNSGKKTKCHETDQYVKDNRCVECPDDATCDGDTATCAATAYVQNGKCEACPAGHMCDGEKKTKCHVTDQYVKDNKCVDCPESYNCNGNEATCDVTKYIENGKCEACPAGHECDGEKKTKCHVTKQYVKDNTCVDCPESYNCDGDNATCDVTKYIENKVCKACPAGHECDGEKKTKCHMTDQYVKDNTCVDCLDGHTCDGHNATHVPCTILTLGAIQQDESVDFDAVMDKQSKKLVISNLHYDYNLCVDPKYVSFGVHPKNDLGFCKTDTILSAVVASWGSKKSTKKDKQTADLTLEIDANKLNAKDLADAYTETNGQSKIMLCVRARVKKGGVEILSTENNIKVTYSMSTQFSVSSVSASRDDNKEAVKDIGTISQKNTAYQCDAKYEKITSPAALSPHSNVLRVCIEGESDAFKCENIVSATLKQKGNADNKLITDGISSGEFTTQSSKDQICMLTTLILPKYFVKKSANDKLSLTLEGSASMPLAPKNHNRRLRRLDVKTPSGDKNFELTVEVLPEGQTDLLPGSQGTASGVCNVVVSMLIVISTLV